VAPAIPGLAFIAVNFLLLLSVEALSFALYPGFLSLSCLDTRKGQSVSFEPARVQQRKSRKNNASSRKKAVTHPAILSGQRAWYFCLMIF
jgi:hypothetical protein